MKVIIAGSRGIRSLGVVQRAIRESKFRVKEVVSGGAQGVDAVGFAWANLHDLPVKVFNADWDTHQRAAGPIRNRAMAAYADALIAVWDGESAGTKNMIEEMEKLSKPVFVLRAEKTEWP